MSPSLSVCLCLLLATAVLAAPADHYIDEDMTGVRMPRATCDLMSLQMLGISVNDSACAAHCLAKLQGFRGGHCINGICHCRK